MPEVEGNQGSDIRAQPCLVNIPGERARPVRVGRGQTHRSGRRTSDGELSCSDVHVQLGWWITHLGFMLGVRRTVSSQ